MPYSKLSGDIYAYIFSFVSSRADLLVVSLANKQFHALSEPELIYRSIRCRLGNDALWEHLIAHPVHASRVREIEIQCENYSGVGPLGETQRLPIGRLDSTAP